MRDSRRELFEEQVVPLYFMSCKIHMSGIDCITLRCGFTGLSILWCGLDGISTQEFVQCSLVYTVGTIFNGIFTCMEFIGPLKL